MIIISGSLTFSAEDHDDVVESLREVTEASRKDAGCVSYHWSVDLEDPNTFWFFECWETREHLDQHLAQPHEAVFGERNLTRMVGATAQEFEATAPPGR